MAGTIQSSKKKASTDVHGEADRETLRKMEESANMMVQLVGDIIRSPADSRWTCLNLNSVAKRFDELFKDYVKREL